MNYSTTLDLRDIASDWLADIEDEDFDAQRPEYVEKYENLCNELGLVNATPSDLESYAYNFEPVLILQSTFQDYAQELAEEIGAINPDRTAGGMTAWPLYCIDWEYAARELAYDYTSISYDGEEYYIRSC